MPSLLNTKWTISSASNPSDFNTLWATFSANNQATIMFVCEPKFQNPATWQEGKRFVTFSLQFHAFTDGSSWSLQGTHDGSTGSGTVLIDVPGGSPQKSPFAMTIQSSDQ
jgi:hypothetical protein